MKFSRLNLIMTKDIIKFHSYTKYIQIKNIKHFYYCLKRLSDC